MSDRRLLIVDDDTHICRVVDHALEPVITCDIAHDVPAARDAIARCDYDLVLLDVGLPGPSGLSLLDELHEHGPQPGVVMMSALDDVSVAEDALARGASGYVVKPFRVKDLRIQVSAALVGVRRAAIGPSTFTPRVEITRALEALLEHHARVACVVIDIEQLAMLGAVYGMQSVDDIITSLATRLEDLGPPVHVLGQLGCASLAVACILQTGGRAEQTGRALHRVVTAPIVVERRTLPVPARIGLAITDAGDAGETILQRAEAAAAAASKDELPFVVYDGDRWNEARHRLELFADAVLAIHGGDLRVVYQPQHDLVTGACVGVEALTRWHHPERGDVPPGVFVPLAEQMGLIEDLGARVRDIVCTDVARLRRRSAGALRRVSVNVSALELRVATYAPVVVAELEAAGIPPSTFCMEVTESLALGRDAELGVLGVLSEAGIPLSVDDFGSGYSSFANLMRVPWTEIKVDRSIVANCETVAGADMMRSIVELAHALGASVVAEGIETRSQLDALRRLGCRYGQGFFLGRPQSIERLYGDGRVAEGSALSST